MLGIVLVALGLSHSVTDGLAIAAYVVGGIALVTGVVRYCPVWSIFGMTTCPLMSGQNE